MLIGAGEPFTAAAGPQLQMEDGIAIGGIGAVAVVVPVAGIAVQLNAAAAAFP